MKEGVQMRYGLISGPDYGFPIQMTAGEAIAWQSGRFVARNTTTGYAEIADTTDDIIGWFEEGEDSSSDSGLIGKCLYSLDAIFRLPLIYDNSTYTTNYSAAILFESCDLKVSGGVQYADPHAATNKTLIIVGGKAATGTTIVGNDGYLDVIISPKNRLDLGVGA